MFRHILTLFRTLDVLSFKIHNFFLSFKIHKFFVFTGISTPTIFFTSM